MTTASSAAAVGIRQARLACKLESHGDGAAFFWVPKPANVGVRPWASAIRRFKRRCSDGDGNTRSKSKAGRSGKGSCTDCRTVLYASPNHKLENFNERNRLIASVDNFVQPGQAWLEDRPTLLLQLRVLRLGFLQRSEEHTS